MPGQTLYLECSWTVPLKVARRARLTVCRFVFQANQLLLSDSEQFIELYG